MKAEQRAVLNDLLTRERILALGVLVDGAPYVGMLPFALYPGYTSLIIHASDLARHSRGLGDGAPFSALVHAADAPSLDPAQVPRVSLEGVVRRLERGSADYVAAREVYVAKLPDSEGLFSLSGFALCSLEIERGRFVAGFGEVRNLSRADLIRVARDDQPE